MTFAARLLRDRRGGISVLAAFGATIALGSVGMAVDLGAVFMESRRLQGIADAAALAAAGDPAHMNSQADAAVAASGWARPVTLDVTPGRWRTDLPPAQRFVAGNVAPNAVRVAARIAAPLYFARTLGLNAASVTRRATAARLDLVGFSVGSRLAAVDGGIANKLFGALTGGSVALSAMDYRALADADVDLLGFVGALRTSATVGSFDQVLAAETAVPAALTALATTLDADGRSAAATAARALAPATASAPVIALSRLIDLGALGRQDRVAGGRPIRVNALDLVRSMIELSGGARQAAFDLGADVPGLSNVSVRLAIGDRPAQSPWVTITGDGGMIVRTAQTRLFVEAQAGTPLPLLGLGSVAVRLPLYVEVAEAQARLSSLSCGAATHAVTLLGQASPGHAAIAEVPVAGFADQQTALPEAPARFVTVGSTIVFGRVRTDLSSGGWQTVPFTTAEVDARETHTITASGTTAALGRSMAALMPLGVSVGGYGVSNPILSAAVGAALQTIAPLVDGLADRLLQLLGVRLGQADLRVNGVRCGTASLVA